MSKKPTHLHKYKRVFPWGKGKSPVYKCMVPGCAHYIVPGLLMGKICECWRCGSAMVIGKYASTLVKPHCNDCIERMDQDSIDKLAEMFK